MNDDPDCHKHGRCRFSNLKISGKKSVKSRKLLKKRFKVNNRLGIVSRFLKILMKKTFYSKLFQNPANFCFNLYFA